MRQFQEVPGWSPGYINVCPHHLDIMVECTACGATGDFQRVTLPEGLRHALVEDIEERLKCSSCGARAGKLRFGHYLDSPGGDR